MTKSIDPTDLYTLMRTPDLIDPVLIVHFDGWIDAGQSGGLAVRHLVEATGADPLVEFDTEWLLDHRARRPTLHIADGVNAGVDWPTIEITAGRDSNDRDVLILSGAEPDHNWRSFVTAIVGLADRFGVRRAVSLGAYPAAVPHTRSSRLTVTSPTVDLARSNEPRATLDVPAGMSAVLEQALDAAGIEALTLWAQVPHYIPPGPYPAATQALLEGLVEAAGVKVDLGTFGEQALVTRNRLDDLVADEDSHQTMLGELERQHDQYGHDGETLPTSDELAAEVEQFLRAQDDEPESDSDGTDTNDGEDTE
ncbi:MAG: putative ATP-grasp superfamily ATP-dependent carboligase [Candidatus Aldehydirespiratoraceae bacterium]|jgi:predicted ATP-grasp superfamily ATP-dependent carboligase